MAQVKCPKCGKNGLLVEKPTVTKSRGKTYTYKKLYVAHYLENSLSKHGKRVNRVQWCYLNNQHINKLKAKGIITQNPHSVTQNITQNVTQNENAQIAPHLVRGVGFEPTNPYGTAASGLHL